MAARLQLADGRRAFVKAVGPEPNPESAEMHRREARVAAALPSAAPASRLLHHHDDGRWVALVFEDVDGRQPVLPWKAAELALVLEAVEQLAETLSPSPIELEPISMVHAGDYAGFDEIRGRLAAGEPLEPLDPWAAENIDLLCRLEAGWVDASRGDTLLQLDLRADNLLIAGGQVVIVDWPHAALGASWIDLMGMLPSVAMQGGPPPWELFDTHAVARAADPAAVDSMLAAITGFFLSRGLRPPPSGLPTVRAFQLAQGAESLAWLRHRLDVR